MLAWLIVAVFLLIIVAAARVSAAPLLPGESRASEIGLGGDLEAGPFDWIVEMPFARPRRSSLDADAIERALGSAPPIARVVETAVRSAGLAGDPVSGWRTRSRLAALLPRVSVRGGISESWREVADLAGPAMVEPTIGHGTTFGASLSWRLDRLLFDPGEPRFAAQDVAIRRERRRVARAAVNAYVSWIEASAAAETDPRAQLALMEATADLDAMTDGWFSHMVSNRTGSR